MVTTFNKELLGQLAQWICDVLDPVRYRIEYDRGFHGQPEKPCKIWFNGSEKENIRLLHFDMLPRYIGEVPSWGKVDESRHENILLQIIAAVKRRNNIRDDQYDNVLNPKFLIEEYHRVIYGLQVGINGAREAYLSVSRKGRGGSPQLKRNSERRMRVWECLEQYARYIYENKIASFTVRRQLFLSKLTTGIVPSQYDYILVDEFQDCTRADFEIFFRLLKHPNYLMVSGDLAQAVHLGKSANVQSLREALRDGREMKDIKWNYLEGSYRLPFRICEAMKKISEHINLTFKGDRAAGILTPYKGAPPGARPIVVIAKGEKEMAEKIRTILHVYRPFDLVEKCILEKDSGLQNELQIPADTVLRLKGLEKHCVIWSTRAPIEFKKEKFEFVYTILSRTSCLLIIALFDDPENPESSTLHIFKDAIGMLRRDRIIIWDKETQQNLNKFCHFVEEETLEEED